jgi:hypothetical protein
MVGSVVVQFQTKSLNVTPHFASSSTSPTFHTNYYPKWKIHGYSLKTNYVVHLDLLFKAVSVS